MVRGALFGQECLIWSGVPYLVRREECRHCKCGRSCQQRHTRAEGMCMCMCMCMGVGMGMGMGMCLCMGVGTGMSMGVGMGKRAHVDTTRLSTAHANDEKEAPCAFQ